MAEPNDPSGGGARPASGARSGQPKEGADAPPGSNPAKPPPPPPPPRRPVAPPPLAAPTRPGIAASAPIGAPSALPPSVLRSPSPPTTPAALAPTPLAPPTKPVPSKLTPPQASVGPIAPVLTGPTGTRLGVDAPPKDSPSRPRLRVAFEGAAAALDRPAGPIAQVAPATSGASNDEDGVRARGAELERRAEWLKESGDTVGAARAFVELGLHRERVVQDRISARAAYESARSLHRGLESALVRVRRLLDGKTELPLALEILDDELGVAEGDDRKADLLAERARALTALGRLPEARVAYADALRHVPGHAASLRGLESVLRRELAGFPPPPAQSPVKSGASAPTRSLRPAWPGADLSAQLAAHLDHLAEAYAPAGSPNETDTRLSAWIHVERSQVLDRALGQADTARVALDRAIAFEPGPGPVRDALTRFLVRHHETGLLVASLAAESESERDDDRAARLLYTAARLLTDKLGGEIAVSDAAARAAIPGEPDAKRFLGRAASRAPMHTPGARRILAELIRLLEGSGELAQAAEVRQKRLSIFMSAGAPPEVIAQEHVRLSEVFDGLGRAAEAALHAERALLLDPNDTSTRDRLDRALQRLGKHEDRVRVWVVEANADRPVPARVRAILNAADIAERHLRRPDEAIAHLRAGWAIDPGNAGIFEALAVLTAPPARDLEVDGRGVRLRLDLYAQAAHVENDVPRRIGLYEKLASIWEDELGQPARAVEVVKKILALEPGRRTAILALDRKAERAGDHKELVAALTAEASVTSDKALERRLLLRAADVLDARLQDRDRALALVERAIAIDPMNIEALRARLRIHENAKRYEESRKTLVQIIAAERDDARRFELWFEVARIDETRLRRVDDAVDAYTEAARVKPRHPQPVLEIARLLRIEGEPKKLVDALLGLAASAPDTTEYARILFQAAEVHELMLGDDKSALECLARADSLLGPESDPAFVEAMERIQVRVDSATDLAVLYMRWIERQPPASQDHRLRVALGGVLAEIRPAEATTLLQGLLGVVPHHVPALRLLEQLHRAAGANNELAAILRAEAEVFTSSPARAGALWELCSLEEHIGNGATLDGLLRLTAESPRDAAALEGIIRIASKLVTGVNVPHPAAVSTKARLVPAVRARKELATDSVTRAMYQAEESLLLEADGREDATMLGAALAGYRDALAGWPESMLAARGLERLAERLGDRSGRILAQLTLAKLVERARDRAGHLVRAAELTAEDGQPRAQAEAQKLYEDALQTDPDSVPAARALARMLAHDVPRLVDRLNVALEAATNREQVILTGTEIARAVLRQSEANAGRGSIAIIGHVVDAGVAVNAMRQVRPLLPHDVPTLLLMARVLLLERVWAEARDTLLHALKLAPPQDLESRKHAYFLLADVYERHLGDPAQAQGALQAVLAIEERNRHALERLVALATARGDRALGIQMLGRLAEATPEPQARVEIDLRLADACREAGDASGSARAFADAIATYPQDGRAWIALSRLYRTETPDGAGAYAASLQQILDIATSRRLPLDPRWLTTLGMLEITALGRAPQGIAHLSQATGVPGATPDVRAAMGRGLEAAGRTGEAIQAFRDLLTPDADTFARVNDLLVVLGSLESALAKEGRVEERVAVEEVRASLGDVAPDRANRFRMRRLPDGVPYAGALAGSELSRLLLPEARTPLLDLSAILAPIMHKILRFELASLGVSSRERLGPRDVHPTRAAADRVARVVGVEAYELYLSPSWQGALRVYPGDPPAIVGSTSFAELPEAEQLFALGRLLTRIALGPTYLDELPIDAADGMLLAALRTVDANFGVGEVAPSREGLAASFLPSVQKAIGRRQRKLIEELLPRVSASYEARTFGIGLRRSEYRIAYVLSGDLLAAIDYLRRFDRDIGRSADDPRLLLTHPVTNEMLRYALSAEGTAERLNLGVSWAGMG